MSLGRRGRKPRGAVAVAPAALSTWTRLKLGKQYLNRGDAEQLDGAACAYMLAKRFVQPVHARLPRAGSGKRIGDPKTPEEAFGTNVKAMRVALCGGLKKWEEQGVAGYLGRG